jgi:hypothetical protein
MADTLGCNSTLNECSMTLATLQNSVMAIVYCRITPRMLFETHPIAESARAYLSVPPPLHAWTSCVRAAVSTTTVFYESVETPKSIFNLQEQTHQFVKQASAHPSFPGDASLHSLHRSTCVETHGSGQFSHFNGLLPRACMVDVSEFVCNTLQHTATHTYICVT